MKTVLVTGCNGFIGKHVIATLSRMEQYELLKYGSEHTSEQLEEMAIKADFIIHLAGCNRPQDPQQYTIGNKQLTEQLLHILAKNGRRTPVLLASSIQATQEHAYGISKKAAEDAVSAYSRDTGAKVYIYRLPNVFGKWCKPYYNSVVATFCYNIAHQMPIEMHDPSKLLTLVYVNDVVSELVNAIEGCVTEAADGLCHVPKGYELTLGQLAEHLYRYHHGRRTLQLPNSGAEIDRVLYPTYLSYLDETDYSYELEMKHDHRGWLAEFIKSDQAGQLFISRTKPGITRGNHWHHTKVEKFLVIEGEAEIKFRSIHNSQVISYHVTGERLCVLDIPPGYTHSITNIGNTDCVTLFWANEIFDSNQPDTYYLEV